VFVPAKISQSSLFLWARPVAYPSVEHLKGSSIGQASALPINIRLGSRLENIVRDKHFKLL